MDELRYIFVPFANKEITIYDKTHEKRRKRMQSEHICDSFVSVEEEEDLDNQLLVCREPHSWVYKGFESYFHKLFDEANETLFQNWTVHCSYGNELDSAKHSEQFINEILSFKEMDKIQSDGEKSVELQSLSMTQKHQSVRMSGQMLETLQYELNSGEYKEIPKEIDLSRSLANHRYETFFAPQWAMDRQILETAFGVAKSHWSDEEEDDHIFIDDWE